MKKHDSKKVREFVGACDEMDVDIPEILRRLTTGDGGLVDKDGQGYPIEISRRAVYYHRTEYRKAKARSQTAQDRLDGSLASVKQRAVDLLDRELIALEGKREGSLGAKEIAAIERIHTALSKIEKTERSGRPQGKGKNGKPEPKKETLWERLAAEEKVDGNLNAGLDENGAVVKVEPAQSPA